MALYGNLQQLYSGFKPNLKPRSESDVVRRETVSTTDTTGHTEEHEDHERIKPFAKVLIAMECPYSAFSYNLKYLMGSRGSFLVEIKQENWAIYTNIGVFLSSVAAVGLSIETDSYWKKFSTFMVGNSICFIASAMLFLSNNVVYFEQKTRLLMNSISLAWMLLYFVVEPVRVALFFDQLPAHMEPHQAGHVFLMYQEMKTLGSLLYIALNKLFKSNLTEIHIGFSVIFTGIPLIYMVVVLSFIQAHDPGSNSTSMGVSCITCFFFSLRRRFIDGEKADGHWLDVAREAYDARTLRNTKLMSSVVFIYMSLLSYGMTSILMKNTWSDQAKNLIEDLAVKKYYIDVNIIYFTLTIVFLPIIEYLLLPLWGKYQKPLTELQKIGITVFLTGFSFIATTILQLQIEKHTTLMPSSGYAQVRIFNTSPFKVKVSADWNFPPVMIPAEGMIEAWNVECDHQASIETHVVSVGEDAGQVNFTGFIIGKPGESMSFLISSKQLFRVEGTDPILSGPPGTNEPDKVRIYLVNYADNNSYPMMEERQKISFVTHGSRIDARAPASLQKYTFQLYPGTYDVTCPGENWLSCNTTLTFERSGLYAVLPFLRDNSRLQLKQFVILSPAVYSVYVMLPQIAILSFAEAMGKIPINLFIFKESPAETRTMSLALYYFSRDGTSIVFAAFSDIFRFQVDSFQLVLVTGIHMVFCFVFVYAALRFQRYPEEDPSRRRRAIMKKHHTPELSSMHM